MISDIGFIGLKYSIGTALKYWEYVAFKYWDRDRRDIFGIGTALLGIQLQCVVHVVCTLCSLFIHVLSWSQIHIFSGIGGYSYLHNW